MKILNIVNSLIRLTSSCLYFIAKFPPSSVDILKCKVSLRTNRLKPLKSQDLTLTKSLLKSSHPPTQLYFTTSLFLINDLKILPSSVAILAKINKAAWKGTQKVLNVPWSMAKWNFRYGPGHVCYDQSTRVYRGLSDESIPIIIGLGNF